jgi:LmbE family N-acetylglucosaminyl deacetylase
MKKVLVICAHPDDDILGCGGYISKYNKGQTEFRIIFIAEGSSCRYSKGDEKNEEIEKVINQRNSFGISALKILGVNNYHFYNLPCGRLDSIPIIEINKIIENEIFNFKPDTIFTHAENDANNDHCIVFKSTIMATRPCGNNIVKSLYSFEILSSSEWNFTSSFEPNYFIELDIQDVHNKWNALSEYKTEIKNFPYPRSFEGILTLSQYRGLQSGFRYAEAYKLIRKIS